MHASTASIASSFGFNAAASLVGRSFARPRPVEIYAQGELAGALYRIEYGAVRIFRLLADGRRQVVAFHVAGETFGFEARAMRSFFAESIVPTGLTTVAIEETGHGTPELMALALESMVRAQEHLLVVGKQNALEKVAVFLVDLFERQGANGTIDLPMTRTDIGDYLGMTIETVSRSFSKLRAMGIIRLESTRCVKVLNLTALRRMGE
jgi:CRP/FNR family nitrogen fixation transcriptional regulator